MKIHNFILNEIEALTLKSTVESAQNFCKNLSITHIPIIENKKFIGCFLENDIQTIENITDTLQNYSHLLNHFYANEKTSVLELLKLFAENDCNLIPVLNQNLRYVGYYELSDILAVFVKSPFLNTDNETLIIEKNKNNYSMSEISQVVEINNGKLMGLFISSEKKDNIQITLKISSNKINEIIQTFRRFEYIVVTKHDDDFYLEDLKNRSDYLKKYINI